MTTSLARYTWHASPEKGLTIYDDGQAALTFEDGDHIAEFVLGMFAAYCEGVSVVEIEDGPELVATLDGGLPLLGLIADCIDLLKHRARANLC